ncbi:MAG: GDSL-type esterase/lipase family protein [Syntrophobacter sp.]
MKKIIFAVLAVCLSLCVSFTLMEIILRIIGYKPAYVNPLPAFHKGDPLLGWVGVPSFGARFKRGDFDVMIQMDAGGFRKSECAIRPEAGARKVLFLGDSFTWGWGVEQGKVFTDVLQGEMGQGFRIGNRGVNAYGTVQEKMLLEREIGQEKPDLVGLVFFMNDFEDNVDPDGSSRPFCTVENGKVLLRNCPVESPLGAAYSPAIRQSYAASLLTYYGDYGIRVVKQKMAARDFQEREKTGLEPDLVAIADTMLAEMKNICSAHGAEFFVVYAPASEDVASDRETVYCSTVRKLCMDHGIGFLDMVGPFRRAEAQKKKVGGSLFFTNDRHWTDEGHRIAGQLIRDYLRTRGS